jgi:hypothetical protein
MPRGFKRLYLCDILYTYYRRKNYEKRQPSFKTLMLFVSLFPLYPQAAIPQRLRYIASEGRLVVVITGHGKGR